MRRLTALAAAIIAAAAMAAPAAGSITTTTQRNRVVHWEHVMGFSISTNMYPGVAGWVQLHPRNIAQEQAIWRWKYNVTRYRFSHPPYQSAWLCIHRYEGSWTDPNSPYYGGLQMDLGFQMTYGLYLLNLKGTADHWTPLEQMWVAVRAHRSGRGFYPWPNTARYCGLI